MDLVFTASPKINEVPFTTDEVMAEFSQNELKSVKDLIRDNKGDLEEFGVLRFQIAKPMAGSKGGRPKKVFHLNQQQATLLITYLDNTEPVRRFKKELVRQFYDMKKELTERRLERNSGKEIRHDLTDAIKEMNLSPHYYKIYSDLVYKTALGFTTKQIRGARGVDGKLSPLDYLTANELTAVNKRSQQIATLILLGMEYSEIKQRISGLKIIYQTTLKTPTKVKGEV